MVDAERGPIEVVVEIPRGSRMKYEYDHARRRFVLDRVLFSSVHYSCDHGFIEESLALGAAIRRPGRRPE